MYINLLSNSLNHLIPAFYNFQQFYQDPCNWKFLGSSARRDHHQPLILSWHSYHQIHSAAGLSCCLLLPSGPLLCFSCGAGRDLQRDLGRKFKFRLGWFSFGFLSALVFPRCPGPPNWIQTKFQSVGPPGKICICRSVARCWKLHRALKGKYFVFLSGVFRHCLQSIQCLN